MASYELNATTRQEFGRGASRRLRRQVNQIPAIMYGGGEPALPLSIDHNQLWRALENESFYSHILTIHIDGKPQRAVLKDLHRHPFRARILHLDLLRITGKEKITMQVPLHFKGEDVAPGVKQGGGIVSHLLSTVEIRCLPDDLPEYIEVDLSNLGLDESFHLSHLKLGKGVELVALAHGNDQAIANIHIPRTSAADEAAATAEAEASAAASAAAAPAAGTAAPAAAAGGKTAAAAPAAKAPAAGGDKDKAKK